MVATTEKRAPVKMAGYLEKRGKMRMVCRWKRLWFVLKGRLLHYYKSQMDYVNLSPCHGSLNMGIAASVRPGKGLELQVFTRSQTIILRAVNKQEHEQWLQALVDAMAQQDYIPTSPLKPVQHFRYLSNEVLFDGIENGQDRLKPNSGKSLAASKSNPERHDEKEEDDDEDHDSSTMMEDTASLLSKSTASNFGTCQSDQCPYRYQSASKLENISESFRVNQRQNIVNRRLERLSLRNGGVASSDTSIPASLRKQEQINTKTLEEKCQSLKELRLNIVENSNSTTNRLGFNKLPHRKEISSFRMSQELRSTTHNELTNKPVNRSESLTSLKNKIPLDKRQLQEMKILIEGKTVYGSSDSIYRKTPSEKSRLLKGNSLYKRDVEKILAKRMLGEYNLYENKEVKSDTDLSVRKKPDLHSGSCGQLSIVQEIKSLEISTNIIKPALNKDLCKSDIHSLATSHKEPNYAECTSFSHDEISNSFNYTKAKSNSLLRKLIKDNEKDELTNERGLQRKGTLKKRSLSFLRRMWKWKESKMEEQKMEIINYDENSTTEHPQIETLEDRTKEKLEHETTHLQVLQPEPPPDYDINPAAASDPVPLLPPRTPVARSPSPWHDIPTNNKPVDLSVDEDKPPPLPKKTRRSSRMSRSTSSGSSNPDSNPFYPNYPSCSDSVVQSPLLEFTNRHSQLDSLDEASDFVFTPFSQPELINCKQENNRKYSDYDVPRLHGTLRNSLRKNSQQDRLIPTHFLNGNSSSGQKLAQTSFEQDSLDANPALWRTVSRDAENTFTPDSLECETPWSLSIETDTLDSTWSRFNMMEDSLSKPFLFTEERRYDDSLNTQPSMAIAGHVDLIAN